MSREMNAGTEPKETPSFFRQAWPVGLLGLIGVLSLLLAPVPEVLLAKDQAFAALPTLAQRGVLLINPTILVLVAAVTGAELAHRVGLRSVLAGTATGEGFISTAGQGAVGGVLLGMFLVAVDTLSAPLMGPAWQALAEVTERSPAHTAMGVLYGGITEEVMLRWGFMSLITWVLAFFLRSHLPRGYVILAIALSALVFAAGHLPAVASQVELSTAIVFRTMLLNTVGGLFFGWLFWRHNLETAMVAHAASHLGIAGWLAVAY